MTYQIADWNIHFENDRSRTRDKCSFVCVPNKQHGMGFCRIVSEPDGAMIYGIWQMILGACSQQSLPRNGWLTDDGDSMGSPWGVDDLSMKFRRPKTEVERALQVLTSDKVRWILTHEIKVTPRGLTADSPPTHLEEKRIEEKGREGNEEPSPGQGLIPNLVESEEITPPPQPKSPAPNSDEPAQKRRLLIESAKEIFDTWNSNATFPKVLILSDKRRRHLESRLKDRFFVANWKQAISRMDGSEFLKGKNDRGWTASFDWFIQPDSVARIMEGKYNGKPAPHRVGKSVADMTEQEILKEAIG